MRKFNIIIFLISIFLGFIIILQIKAMRPYQRISANDTNQDLTFQVISLIKKVNTDRAKVLELQNQYDDYQKALSGSLSSAHLVNTDIDHYQKFLGQKEITGLGVEIIVNQNLSVEEAIDFINNLKNIGVEAISINDNRLILSSAFEGEKDNLKINNRIISSPYRIKAIGNPDVLKESLTRKGGMLEKLKITPGSTFEVIKSDNLQLPAYN
jgi:uncharacterized protein YlxW (UPF0749 family)